MAKNDPVNHPAHYADHYPHEVIELTEHLGFCLGNAVKYILRAPFKGNELEDLKKARWYVNRVLENEGECVEIDLDYEVFRELVLSFDNAMVTTLMEGALDIAEGYFDELPFMCVLKALDDRISELEEPAKPKVRSEEEKKHDEELVAALNALAAQTKAIKEVFENPAVKVFWSNL